MDHSPASTLLFSRCKSGTGSPVTIPLSAADLMDGELEELPGFAGYHSGDLMGFSHLLGGNHVEPQIITDSPGTQGTGSEKPKWSTQFGDSLMTGDGKHSTHLW